MRLVHCLPVLAIALTAGCSTYLDDLNRGEAHSAANEHERALALFRVDEADVDSLSQADQTRYFYLRGMNDYRLGQPFRADARHWLALARAHEVQVPGSLKSEWKERLEEALKDLNQDVYGVGVIPESDDTKAKSDDKSSDKSEKSSKEEGGKPECKKDADCEGDLVCSKGRCAKSK